MAVRRFRRNFMGRSTFPCRVCERLTRDTGDNGGSELCPECYELAGIENALSDHGWAQAVEWGYVAEAERLLTALAKKKGANMAGWDDLREALAKGGATT